jgi:hypothetical protein
MQDGEDAFMHEGGSQAPTPSNVAENLAAGGTVNTEAFNAHIVDEALEEHGKKLARREARAAEKAEKALNNERARADGVQGTGPEGAHAGVDPAAAIAFVVRPGNEASSKPQDAEEHVGEANGKAKRKRGQRKHGRGGQGAKVGPDSGQPLLLSKDVPPPLSVSKGGPGFLTPINVLTFSSLVSRGRLRWTESSLAPTGQSLPAGTNLLYMPPGAARLVETPGDLLPNQL